MWKMMNICSMQLMVRRSHLVRFCPILSDVGQNVKLKCWQLWPADILPPLWEHSHGAEDRLSYLWDRCLNNEQLNNWTYFARHLLSYLEDRLFYLGIFWCLNNEHTLLDILCLTLCFLNQLQILLNFWGAEKLPVTDKVLDNFSKAVSFVLHIYSRTCACTCPGQVVLYFIL